MSYKKVLKVDDNNFVSSFQKVLISSHANQLLDKSTYPASKTSNGIEFTNNGDGTITASGTSTANNGQYALGGSYVHLIQNHVYYMTGCPAGGATTTYYMACSIYNGSTYVGGGSDTGNGVRFVVPDKNYTRYGISLNYRKDSSADNQVWKPQLIDLTYWFGKGKEPKTAAKAKAKITEFYGYFPPVKSYKSALITPTKNLFDLQTAVDGYIDSNGVLQTVMAQDATSDYIDCSADTAYACFAYQGAHLITSSYSLWIAISWYTADKTFIKRDAVNSMSETQETIFITCTAPSNAVYCRVSSRWMNADYRKEHPENYIQFEKGTTSTDYVPYQYL